MVHGPSKGFCAMLSASLGFYSETSAGGNDGIGAFWRLLLAVC